MGKRLKERPRDENEHGEWGWLAQDPPFIQAMLKIHVPKPIITKMSWVMKYVGDGKFWDFLKLIETIGFGPAMDFFDIVGVARQLELKEAMRIAGIILDDSFDPEFDPYVRKLLSFDTLATVTIRWGHYLNFKKKDLEVQLLRAQIRTQEAKERYYDASVQALKHK